MSLELLKNLKVSEIGGRVCDEFSTLPLYDVSLKKIRDESSLEYRALRNYEVRVELFVPFKCREDELAGAAEVAKKILVQGIYQDILFEISNLERLSLFGGTRTDLSEVVTRMKKKLKF